MAIKRGNAKRNTLNGTNGKDSLFGLGGNDTLNGKAGNDKLFGGTGNDKLFGGAGNDVLDGGKGRDTLDGGTGDDTLNGGLGADTMKGGAGNDTYIVDDLGDTVNDTSGTDTVMSSLSYTLGADIENLVLTGAALNGSGNAGANTITGNAGDNILNGGAGADALAGGDGSDTASYEGSSGVLIAMLQAIGGGLKATGDSVGDTYDSIENLRGNNDINILGGDNGNNRLEGLGGDDYMFGRGGADTLDGGSNWFEGDTVSYLLSQSSGVTITLTAGGASGADIQGDEATGDVLINIENIQGTYFDDQLTGDDGNNRLDGAGGSDTLDGRLGNDTLDAGADGVRDTIVISGNSGPSDFSGNDTVLNFTKGAGGDRLFLSDATFLYNWQLIENNGNSVFNFTDGLGGVLAQVQVIGVTAMVNGTDYFIF